jgi:hypothetical protein
MEALLDNDVLYKLARFGLLADFEQLLLNRGYTRPHGRTAAAPWSMRSMKDPPPADRWPDPAQAVAFRDFCFQRCQGVTGAQATHLDALNVPAFDAGEVALVARALEVHDAIVFTGDKRAIQAMASEPQLATVKVALARRIIHLEMVMETLSNELGWDIAAHRVLASGVDIRLQKVYRQSTHAAMARVLSASIGALRTVTDDLLAPAF